MSRRIVVFLAAFLFIGGLFCRAQVDTLLIQDDFHSTNVGGYFHHFNTQDTLSALVAWHTFLERQDLIARTDRINFGPINGFYWFALTIKNVTNLDKKLYLEIRQPHIYRMIFYRVFHDSIKQFSETGIHYTFYQRPTPSRFFDFPVYCQAGETYTILLMVHHINSLSLPMFLSTHEVVEGNNYRQNLVWGYWFGFLSFCALFAFMASIVLRKSVFLWYFLYISSAALFGFTEQGYSFQFFFPGWADVEATAIIQLSTYVFIFLIKFSQGLLETRKYLLRTHLVLNGMFYFMITLILSAYVMPDVMFRYSTVVLPMVNMVLTLGLLLLAYCGIKALRTNRIVAIFYLIAYSTLVAAAVFTILNYGIGMIQYYGPNPILIAYFLEAMLLSVALVILFRQIQRDRTALAVELAEQQKTMYRQYIDGIEKERSRIAGELHDDVGSRLSYLKRLLQTHSDESLKTADQIDQLIQDVRQLSHDLSPPLAHVSGLEPLLEKLITDARRATGIDIKFQAYNLKDSLTPLQKQQVYRIVQEALNNIIKHSEASRADVQLFEYSDEMNIVVEDNGRGFDSKSTKDGFGLNQMRIRTENLGGRIEVNSHEGTGTHILVQIPLKKES